jgi:hypothetical protein
MSREGWSSRGRSSVASVAIGAAVLALFLAATAGAAGLAPKILSPSRSRVVAGKTTTLRVRGSRIRVTVGSRDVTKRLGKPVDGVRSLTLHRGKDFHLGSNRVVIATGKGRHRRYVSRVFLAARPAKLLTLHRGHGQLAAVEYKGHSKAKLGRLLVTVDGSRFAQRRLIRADGRSFALQLGIGDGLRYGRNRIVIQALSLDGRRVSRLTRTVRVSRTAPLADAGPDRRAAVGRPVRLGARGTAAAHPGDRLGHVWQIVSAPRCSKAHLRAADSAHPRLVTDLPGRYRIRLVATEAERPAPRPGAAGASAAAPEGADVMTLEASPTESPLGEPIETIGANGIVAGGKTYPAGSGWVQLLVLDRSTLAEVTNKTFPTEPGGQIGAGSIEELQVALAEATSEDLVILSGGDRGIGFSDFQLVPQLQAALSGIGVADGPQSSPDGFGTFESGEWSAIGIPGSEPGSGTTNFSGNSSGGFGNVLPAGRPGSLQGYLHYSPTPPDPADSDLGGGYLFLSPDHAPIDTEGTKAGAGTVSIEVDGQADEESVSPGESGFDLLLLNHRLEPISNRAYVTNANGGGEDLGGVEELDAALYGLYRGAVHPDLVILQSFGKPGGRDPYWVSDNGIRNYPWGNQSAVEASPLVGNEFPDWYEPQEGLSLAAAVGWLGGPVAHDQFAQLVSSPPTPSPADSGGFTLIAPYEEPSAAYSQSEEGSHLRSARVAGDLILNADSNWEVAAPSESAAFNSELLDVVYQAPQPWPDSGTPGFEAADRYIAEALDLGTTNVRQAYYTDDTDSWTAKYDELKERVHYPAGNRKFSRSEFEKLRQQLLQEFLMVQNLQTCIDTWQEAFVTSEGKGQVNLKKVAEEIEREVQVDISSQSAELNTDLIAAHSLGIAAGIAGSTGVAAPVAGALGAISNAFSLANDFSTSKSGSLSSLPVKAKASELGEELSRRYEGLQSSFVQIEDILVSDWGKLQAANAEDADAAGGWALNKESKAALTGSLTDSAAQQAAAAMMPLAYGEYLVSPVSTGNNPEPSKEPWAYQCSNNDEINPGMTEPLNPSYENPNSWIAFPFELTGNDQVGFQTRLQSRVMAIQGELEWFNEAHDGDKVVHEPHVLSMPFADKLFEPATAGGYGIDRVGFFADPAFPRWPLYC